MSKFARLISLPTAAPQPVEQRRRGRLPRGVARLAEYRNAAMDEAGLKAVIDEIRILEKGAQHMEAAARKMRVEALELRQRAGMPLQEAIAHDG